MPPLLLLMFLLLLLLTLVLFCSVWVSKCVKTYREFGSAVHSLSQFFKQQGTRWLHRLCRLCRSYYSRRVRTLCVAVSAANMSVAQSSSPPQIAAPAGKKRERWCVNVCVCRTCSSRMLCAADVVGAADVDATADDWDATLPPASSEARAYLLANDTAASHRADVNDDDDDGDDGGAGFIVNSAPDAGGPDGDGGGGGGGGDDTCDNVQHHAVTSPVATATAAATVVATPAASSAMRVGCSRALSSVTPSRALVCLFAVPQRAAAASDANRQPPTRPMQTPMRRPHT